MYLLLTKMNSIFLYLSFNPIFLLVFITWCRSFYSSLAMSAIKVVSSGSLIFLTLWTPNYESREEFSRNRLNLLHVHIRWDDTYMTYTHFVFSILLKSFFIHRQTFSYLYSFWSILISTNISRLPSTSNIFCNVLWHWRRRVYVLSTNKTLTEEWIKISLSPK